MHSNIQESATTKQQQNTRGELSAHAFRQSAVAEEACCCPGDQSTGRCGEGEDDEVGAGSALGEALLEEGCG